MASIENISKIMKLGFNRNDSGTLYSYINATLKYKDLKFLTLGLRLFKDKRTNIWADDSKCPLFSELTTLFNLTF
jgi:hypothetical protein